jgi:hypothetical protein
MLLNEDFLLVRKGVKEQVPRDPLDIKKSLESKYWKNPDNTINQIFSQIKRGFKLTFLISA